jgi:hypothetical protein
MGRRNDPSHIFHRVRIGEHRGLTHDQRVVIAVLCGAVVVGLILFFAL